jgi:hypothetical protein
MSDSAATTGQQQLLLNRIEALESLAKAKIPQTQVFSQDAEKALDCGPNNLHYLPKLEFRLSQLKRELFKPGQSNLSQSLVNDIKQRIDLIDRNIALAKEVKDDRSTTDNLIQID